MFRVGSWFERLTKEIKKIASVGILAGINKEP